MPGRMGCAAAAVAAAIAMMHGASQATAPLRSRFAAPGNENRMLKIVHGWPDEPDAARALLDGIARQGYGGVVTNVNFDGGYTGSEQNWTKLASALAMIRQRGMKAWLYDEAGYPSGRAGALVLEGHPELEVHGLRIVVREAGPGPIEIQAPPGRVLKAEAFPLAGGAIAVDRGVPLAVQGGKANWHAPSGRWQIVVVAVDRLFDGTQVASSGYPEKTPYVGLMEPGLAARFLSLTHDRYARRLGRGLSETFTATFTDEPSTMAIYFGKMPWAVLPWCADFAEQFRSRRGYDLLNKLALLAVEAGDEGKKVRCDYYRTVTELMTERWWEPLRRWSRRNRVPSGGHLLLEENILHHVPLYGSAYEAFRHMDSPGIDCLSSDPSVPRYGSMAGMGADIPWNAARLASSAAELDGKPLVMCEVSEHIQNAGGVAGKLTLEQYHATWARLIIGGVNVLTSYHSFPGWPDERVRAANDWIGRCIAATRGGMRAAKVAVVYPVETVWARFTPSSLWVEDASAHCKRVEGTLRDLSEALYASRREFDYIDGRILAGSRIEGPDLVYKRHRWRAVVVPECDTLPERAWRNLAALHQAGGTVVLLGDRPRNCPEHFPCRVASKAGRQLLSATRPASLLESHEAARVTALLDTALERDLNVEPLSPLRMTRRRVGTAEVWFVLNDSPRRWSGIVDVPADGTLEVWDPTDGSVRPFPSSVGTLTFQPYAALILRTSPASSTPNALH